MFQNKENGIMPRKIVFAAFLGIVFFWCCVNGIEITLINDLPDIEQSKKIMLRVSLGIDDKAVYKDMMRFSSSNKNIKLRYWKPSEPATTDDSAIFKQTKRVFHSSFDVALSFEKKPGAENNFLADYLAHTEIVVSCLVAKTDGTSYAHALCLSLVPHKETKGLHRADDVYLLPQAGILSAVHEGPEVLRDTESFYLKQSNSFLDQILVIMHYITRASAPWILAAMVLFLFFWGIAWKYVHKRFRKFIPVFRRRKKIIFIMCPLGVVGALGYLVPSAITYLSFGLYFGIFGIFLIMLRVKNSRLQTLTQFLGGCCIVVAPVLMVWGILLFWGTMI